MALIVGSACSQGMTGGAGLPSSSQAKATTSLVEAGRSSATL